MLFKYGFVNVLLLASFTAASFEPSCEDDFDDYCEEDPYARNCRTIKRNCKDCIKDYKKCSKAESNLHCTAEKQLCFKDIATDHFVKTDRIFNTTCTWAEVWCDETSAASSHLCEPRSHSCYECVANFQNCNDDDEAGPGCNHVFDVCFKKAFAINSSYSNEDHVLKPSLIASRNTGFNSVSGACERLARLTYDNMESTNHALQASIEAGCNSECNSQGDACSMDNRDVSTQTQCIISSQKCVSKYYDSQLDYQWETICDMAKGMCIYSQPPIDAVFCNTQFELCLACQDGAPSDRDQCFNASMAGERHVVMGKRLLLRDDNEEHLSLVLEKTIAEDLGTLYGTNCTAARQRCESVSSMLPSPGIDCNGPFEACESCKSQGKAQDSAAFWTCMVEDSLRNGTSSSSISSRAVEYVASRKVVTSGNSSSDPPLVCILDKQRCVHLMSVAPQLGYDCDQEYEDCKANASATAANDTLSRRIARSAYKLPIPCNCSDTSSSLQSRYCPCPSSKILARQYNSTQENEDTIDWPEAYDDDELASSTSTESTTSPVPTVIPLNSKSTPFTMMLAKPVVSSSWVSLSASPSSPSASALSIHITMSAGMKATSTRKV